MATSEQVKQCLELALSLAQSLSEKESDALLVYKIQEALKVIDIETEVEIEQKKEKTPKHPVDAILKKGKVELNSGRYKQLVQIYDELMIQMSAGVNPPNGLKFLNKTNTSHGFPFL